MKLNKGHKKFCDKVVKKITDQLLIDGYSFDYNSFGVDGFVLSMKTISDIDKTIISLQLPYELSHLEYLIFQRVVNNLRIDNKKNKENIRLSKP